MTIVTKYVFLGFLLERYLAIIEINYENDPNFVLVLWGISWVSSIGHVCGLLS